MTVSAKLANTKDITLMQEAVQVESGERFAEMQVYGDGNCAFNAVSSMYAGMIRSGRFPENESTKSKFQEFLKAMREKQRVEDLNQLKLDYARNNSKAIVPLLEEFMEKFINDPKKEVSWEEFKTFVMKQKTRVQIAGLQVALAPGLRQIALQEAVRLNLNIDSLLPHNRKSVDAGAMVLACNFFDLDAQVFIPPSSSDVAAGRRNPTLQASLKPAPNAARRPAVVAIHRGGNHFNLLIPHDELGHSAWKGLTHTEIRKGEASEFNSDVTEALGFAATHLVKRAYQLRFDELFAKKVNEKLESSEKEDNSLYESALSEAIEFALSDEKAEEKLQYREALENLGFFREKQVEVEMLEEEAALDSFSNGM